MKITTLVDNTTHDEELFDEHGLSVHISLNGRDILFDTGMTNKFSMNAAKLDINLRAVDVALISHAHYDHLGGLIDFLSLNDLAQDILNNAYPLIENKQFKNMVNHRIPLKDAAKAHQLMDSRDFVGKIVLMV